VVYTNEGYFTIFGNPTNLAAVAFSTLMGLSGGISGAYLSSKGEPFWTISGGLAGVISVAPAMDLYHPAAAFVIALVGGAMIPYMGRLLERFRIDDVVGAVTVHGGCAVYGLVVSGFVLWGIPNVAIDGFSTPPDINPLGQIGGAVVLAALGFIPGYGVSRVLKAAKMLRIPPEVESLDLDLSEVWYRISTDDPIDLMPPRRSKLALTEEDIALIGKWIEQGAEYRPHWAFLPVAKPPVPKLQDGWARNRTPSRDQGKDRPRGVLEARR
jgi:hypothetical protein